MYIYFNKGKAVTIAPECEDQRGGADRSDPN